VIHELRATPETCFWGFFDAARPPVFRVRPGDLSFLVDQKGLSRDDAYSLISVAGDFGVTQVGDQRQGVHGMIAKNLFVPPVSV
jgi:hypothetical protein